MNIVARLKNVEEVSHLIAIGADVVMLDIYEFTTKALLPLDKVKLKEINQIIKKSDIKTYVWLNKMIHETDLELLESWLELLRDIDIDGIVINDITIYVIALKLGIANKIIYQPGTMNTNSFDAEYFEGKIKGITLSKEITLDEITKIIHRPSRIEFSILGHGFIDMFYSKRKLLTNYYIHKGIQTKNIQNNHQFLLEEKTRDGIYYPILEDKLGTHIFRDKKLNSFDEIPIIREFIKDIFLERIFMSDLEYYDSIKVYKDLKKKSEFLNKYGLKYNSGFYYLPTEKIKGGLHVD